jgi:uncharacterized lipoprotein YmbA
MKNRTCFAKFAKYVQVLIILTFLQAGCSTTTGVKYYTLSGIQADKPRPIAMKAVTIGLGPVIFPGYLDRPQIVTRKSQNRVVLSEFNRWAGSFKEDFLRVLKRDLSMLLPSSDMVVKHPWTDKVSPDYQILLTVSQFDGQFGHSVVLTTEWSVWDKKNAHEILRKQTVVTEPLEADSYEALVETQSRAVAALSVIMVNSIAEKLSR